EMYNRTEKQMEEKRATCSLTCTMSSLHGISGGKETASCLLSLTSLAVVIVPPLSPSVDQLTHNPLSTSQPVTISIQLCKSSSSQKFIENSPYRCLSTTCNTTHAGAYVHIT
ncbi:hypothetical protein Ahia01_001016800, partial [Argonauta hians]